MNIRHFILISVLLVFANNIFAQTIDKDKLISFYVNKLNTSKIPKKELKFAREAADQFTKLADLENFTEVFDFNPVLNTYTIHLGEMPSNLARLNWSGWNHDFKWNSKKLTPTELKQKYNSLAGRWLIDFLKIYPPKKF